MKTSFIRAGKTVSLLKQEGLVHGTKILFSKYLGLYFKTMFSPATGDVLIVTSGVGDVAHYRAHNYAEELNFHGIKTSVMLEDNPFLSRYIDNCKVFIFQRISVSPKIARIIEKIKKQNKEIIFETDDLVFDPKFIQATDLYKNQMNAAERLQYQKGVGEEFIKDPYVKVCTTSTSYLAKILESYGKKVFIITNKFSEKELAVTQNILDNIPKETDDSVRIGYFSGTPSHNSDFATITNALFDVMEKYPTVKLFIAGKLDPEERLNKFKDRIFSLPLVSRDKYYENLWKVDINLAPLVSGDPFCESKSAIKFTEAGILKIPTVAVKNQTFSETINDGVDGFLAGTRQEWKEKLARLIEDAEKRQKMGEAARAKILEQFSIRKSRTDDYYEYLQGLINK